MMKTIEIHPEGDWTDRAAAQLPRTRNWINSTQAELQVFFQTPMNQSSVEQAVDIRPEVSYNVEWRSDEHLEIHVQTPSAAYSTYQQVIAQHAADRRGIPLACT